MSLKWEGNDSWARVVIDVPRGEPVEVLAVVGGDGWGKVMVWAGKPASNISQSRRFHLPRQSSAADLVCKAMETFLLMVGSWDIPPTGGVLGSIYYARSVFAEELA